MSDRRELYRSPNGETWFLGREPTDGRAFIIHQPNAPAGSRRSHIELGEFLRSDTKGPEQKALLRLIATLVDVPLLPDMCLPSPCSRWDLKPCLAATA